MGFIADTWRWLKLQKEGMFFGAIVGIIIYIIYTNTTGAPLFAVDSPAMIDKMMSIGTRWKYLIGLILIGMTVGAGVDAIKDPRK